MHVPMILFGFLVAVFIKFWDVVYEFIINARLIVAYIIPFTVQISLATICTVVRGNINETISVRDVIIICATPGIIALLPYIFPGLQKLLSSSAKYTVYSSCLGVLGLISNTFILIFGGLIGFYKF
ncbi:MAG: hypothetical protein KI793_16500 [Rivularia sp. (in: Bacteria)]|nr:hypothetical protein [Rivularia sp. MS3]